MSLRKPFDGNFPLTQGFGENPASYAKFGISGHNGLDYGLPTGTPVIAPHSGKVIESASDPTGYGNYLKIENDKEGSVLAHLKGSLVIVGDLVTAGQNIAVSNNTGNSTGPHLHWGYYKFPRDRQNGYAGFIDQLPLLNQPTENPVPSNQVVWTKQTKIPVNTVTVLEEYKEVELGTLQSQLMAKDQSIKDLKSANNQQSVVLEEYQKQVEELNNDLGKVMKDLASYKAQQELAPATPITPPQTVVKLEPAISGPLVDFLQFLKRKLGF